MTRDEAKTRLAQLRKGIDALKAERSGLVDRLIAREISAETATAREITLKSELAEMEREFRAIASLPCCNI
jgi:predicted  nucleic acid-binding Zn-ribbon protein